MRSAPLRGYLVSMLRPRDAPSYRHPLRGKLEILILSVPSTSGCGAHPVQKLHPYVAFSQIKDLSFRPNTFRSCSKWQCFTRPPDPPDRSGFEMKILPS